jgi:hypothetical protein
MFSPKETNMVPSDLFCLTDKAIDGIIWLFAPLDIVSLLLTQPTEDLLAVA